MEVSGIIASIGTIRSFKSMRNFIDIQFIFLQCLPMPKLGYGDRGTLNMYDKKDGSCWQTFSFN